MFFCYTTGETLGVLGIEPYAEISVHVFGVQSCLGQLVRGMEGAYREGFHESGYSIRKMLFSLLKYFIAFLLFWLRFDASLFYEIPFS